MSKSSLVIVSTGEIVVEMDRDGREEAQHQEYLDKQERVKRRRQVHLRLSL